jgi:hypothetical protein
MSNLGRWDMQTRKIGTATWMASAFVVGLALAVTVYAVGTPAHRLGMALRTTARWSFLWFCLATYGGALTALFGSRFQALARHGRDFGLAFTAAHSVHIGVVAWLFYSAPQAIPPPVYLIVFFIGAFWVYVLAAFTLSSTLSSWLGARRWALVRKIGVEYIAFAFAFDFVPRTFGGTLANALYYAPFAAASVGGPLLRIAAAIKRRAGARGTAGLVSN